MGFRVPVTSLLSPINHSLHSWGTGQPPGSGARQIAFRTCPNLRTQPALARRSIECLRHNETEISGYGGKTQSQHTRNLRCYLSCLQPSLETLTPWAVLVLVWPWVGWPQRHHLPAESSRLDQGSNPLSLLCWGKMLHSNKIQWLSLLPGKKSP